MDNIIKELKQEQIVEIVQKYDTPLFLYSEEIVERSAKEVLDFPHEFGLTVRYAMKALPTKRILTIFNNVGLHIDASSYYEVLRAKAAGIPPTKIQLTAQEWPDDPQLLSFLSEGGLINACSLHQLERIGKLVEKNNSLNNTISIRINPGIGSGSMNRVNVGGSAASFGIWHESLNKIKIIASKYNLAINRLHTHIGSGSDPEIWKNVAKISLQLVEAFPKVHTLNLGGGFKVARISSEKATNIQECGKVIQEEFKQFYTKTGRKLYLEIEPGTFLVANAGILISKVIDIKSTDTYSFIIVNSGMTEVTRPTLYGAQHPLTLIPQTTEPRQEKEYIVCGHCCESGDIWTPQPHNPENVMPRIFPQAKIGDFMIIGGIGAYCSGMSLKNYNSFPEAPEVLLRKDKTIELIRKKAKIEEIYRNEI